MKPAKKVQQAWAIVSPDGYINPNSIRSTRTASLVWWGADRNQWRTDKAAGYRACRINLRVAK